MAKKIHKKLSPVTTKCGINLFKTSDGLFLVDDWKRVTCKKCLKKKPKKGVLASLKSAPQIKEIKTNKKRLNIARAITPRGFAKAFFEANR